MKKIIIFILFLFFMYPANCNNAYNYINKQEFSNKVDYSNDRDNVIIFIASVSVILLIATNIEISENNRNQVVIARF